MQQKAAAIARSVLPPFLAVAPLLRKRMPADDAAKLISSCFGAACGVRFDLATLHANVRVLAKLAESEPRAATSRKLLRATDAAETIWLCSYKRPHMAMVREAAGSALS